MDCSNSTTANLDNDILDNSENIKTNSDRDNSSVESKTNDIKVPLTEEERERLNKAKINAELKKKLLKQMSETQFNEVFDNFVSEQKKPKRKKFVIATLVCLIILLVPAIILYMEHFVNNSIMRKTNIGMNYYDVIESEKSLFDSKEPEIIGESMLIYNDVKYKSIQGDVIYYFHHTQQKLSLIAFKFDYSKENYDFLVNSLKKQYGECEEVEKKESEDIRIMWTFEDGIGVRLVSSKKQNTIEVDIGKI